MEDTPFSSISTKRSREEDQTSPIRDISAKQTCLSRYADSRTLTIFLRIPVILPSRIPHTSMEVVAAALAQDLSFVQELYEVGKMKLLSEVTFSTYWVISLFSLAAASRGDKLALEKGKCEALEKK